MGRWIDERRIRLPEKSIEGCLWVDGRMDVSEWKNA